MIAFGDATLARVALAHWAVELIGVLAFFGEGDPDVQLPGVRSLDPPAFPL